MPKAKAKLSSCSDFFVPFGPEWEKEIMKVPKLFIVGMLRKALLANQAAADAMPLSSKPEANEVQTAQAVDPAAICSPPLWPEELDKLRDLKVGHECEAHVLPRKGDETRLTPVYIGDGRGEWKKGYLSGINLCVAFDDGTHCWIHPAHINSDYGSKCRLLEDASGRTPSSSAEPERGLMQRLFCL
jgi:hypothetical protein